MHRIRYGCCSCLYIFHVLTSALAYHSRYAGQDIVVGGQVLGVTPTGHLIRERLGPAAPDVDPTSAGPVKSSAIDPGLLSSSSQSRTLDKIKHSVESSLLGRQEKVLRIENKQRQRSRRKRIRKAKRGRKKKHVSRHISWIQTKVKQRRSRKSKPRLLRWFSPQPSLLPASSQNGKYGDPQNRHSAETGQEHEGLEDREMKAEKELDEEDGPPWEMTYFELLEMQFGWIIEFLLLVGVCILLVTFWPYKYIGMKFQDEEFMVESEVNSGPSFILYQIFWGQNPLSYVVNFVIIAVTLSNFALYCIQTEVKTWPDEETLGINWGHSEVTKWNWEVQLGTCILLGSFIVLRVIGSTCHPFWGNFGGSAPMMFLMGDVFTHIEIVAMVPSIIDFVTGEDHCMNLTWIAILRTAEMMARQESTGIVLRQLDELWDHVALISMVMAIGLIVWVAMSGMYFVANRDNEKSLWEAATFDGDPFQRFGSIPCSMWFVLLNLSCEDPLADVHQTFLERFCVIMCCLCAVPFFSMPTGIFGGVLAETATNQLGNESEDGGGSDAPTEEENQKKHHQEQLELVHWTLPAATTALSIASVWTYFFWTASRHHNGKMDSHEALSFRFLWLDWKIDDDTLAIVDGGVSVIFALEWIFWLVYGQVQYIFSIGCLIDLLSWLPGLVHAVAFFKLVIDIEYKEDEHLYWDWLRLMCLIRLLKTERFVGAFREMAEIVSERGALLKGTMYIAFILLLFFSTQFYWTEEKNPEGEMRENFGSSARAVWALLINLHGEWVWMDYMPLGKAFGTLLDFTAIGICMVPIVIFSEAYQDRLDERDDDSMVLKPWQHRFRPDEDDGEGLQVQLYDLLYMHLHIKDKFLPFGFKFFRSISVFCTLLSTISTITLNLERMENKELEKEHDAMLDTFKMLFWITDIVCALWFTMELFLRIMALGGFHLISFVGVADLVSLAALVASIIPDIHEQCFHPNYEEDYFEPAVVPCRLLRLIVLESYIPVFHTLTNIFWMSRYALLRSLYALLVVWYWFASLLYMCERDLTVLQHTHEHHFESGKHAQRVEEAEEADDGEDMEMFERYENILSGLQYALVHMTGDYPITEYILPSKIVHFFGCQLGMIVIACFNGILTASFIYYLEEERGIERVAEAQTRMDKALSAVYVLQFRFRRMRKKRLAIMSGSAGAGGQWSPPAEKSHPFRFMRELTHYNRPSGYIFMGICHIALFLNVVNTMLASIDELEDEVGMVFDIIELVTTFIFILEYMARLLSHPKPCMNILKPMRLLDLVCLTPTIGFIIHETTVHRYRSEKDEEFWESFLEFARVLRVIRIIDWPFFRREARKTTKTLSNLLGVLALPSVMALQIWVLSSSMFVLVENMFNGPENEHMSNVANAMYWTSIFVLGEWANVDFSPGAGSRVCIWYCLVGICFFAIPVSLTIESVQDTLASISEERKELARLYKIGKEGAGAAGGPMGFQNMGTVMRPGFPKGAGKGAEFGMPFGPPPGPPFGPPGAPFGPPGAPFGPPGTALFMGPPGGPPIDFAPPGPPGGPPFVGPPGGPPFAGPPVGSFDGPPGGSFGGPPVGLGPPPFNGSPGGPPFGPVPPMVGQPMSGPPMSGQPMGGPPMSGPALSGPAADPQLQAKDNIPMMTASLPHVDVGPPRIARPPAPEPFSVPRPPGPLSPGGNAPPMSQPPSFAPLNANEPPNLGEGYAPMHSSDPFSDPYTAPPPGGKGMPPGGKGMPPSPYGMPPGGKGMPPGPQYPPSGYF